MRTAEAADWLRRLSARQGEGTTKISRIALEAVPSIGEIEIPIQSALTVLAGPNGAGKTTMLRAIWAALEPISATPIIVGRRKLISGNAQVDLVVEGQAECARVSFTPESIEQQSATTASVQHIDGSTFSSIYQPQFCGFESSSELLNGVGAVELDGKELIEVCFILNRNYRAIRFFEVELDGTVPFFEVSYGDDTYDSRTMGAGEMSALYLWWSIRRAGKNSVILVEEPEAYLSVGCQDNLAMFLVKTVVQRGLVAIVSSHSSSFISTMPKASLIFMARGEGGLAMIDDQPPPVLLKQLGICPPTLAIVFVEDSMGRLFCRAILERYDAALSRQTHIDQRKGNGAVRTALRPMLGVESPLRFLGAFDGDMRTNVEADLLPQSTFLPGDKPLETTFREMVSANPQPFSEEVRKANLGTILGALEGLELHDWYEALAAELGYSRDQLFSALFKVWISDPENEKTAKAAYCEIAELIHKKLEPAA